MSGAAHCRRSPPSAGLNSCQSSRGALDDAPLRVDAIRAIAAYDDEALGKLLIAQFQTFNSAEKYEAVQTLASRGRYGRMLTEALASGGISQARRAAVRRAAAAARGRRQVRGRVGSCRANGPERHRGACLRQIPRAAQRQRRSAARTPPTGARSSSAPAAPATRCTARAA